MDCERSAHMQGSHPYGWQASDESCIKQDGGRTWLKIQTRRSRVAAMRSGASGAVIRFTQVHVCLILDTKPRLDGRFEFVTG